MAPIKKNPWTSPRRPRGILEFLPREAVPLGSFLGSLCLHAGVLALASWISSKSAMDPQALSLRDTAPGAGRAFQILLRSPPESQAPSEVLTGGDSNPNLQKDLMEISENRPKTAERPQAETAPPDLKEPRQGQEAAAEAANRPPDAPAPPAPSISAPPPQAGEPSRIESRDLALDIRPRYPDRCRRLGHEGTALLRFYLNSELGIERVELLQSAGCEELDQEVLRAARKASLKSLKPLPPGKAALHAVEIPIRFRL